MSLSSQSRRLGSWLRGSIALLVLPLGLSCGSGGFVAQRAAHPTQLSVRGPAQRGYQPIGPVPGVQAIRYRSGGLELKAFLMRPVASPESTARPAAKAPALVYLHGNFSLEPESFEHLRPFVDAGYVVLVPTYRGEQGNPGAFELLYGELDDAAAAVRWFASQPFVDAGRIDAIGHSVGGALCALLSLLPDLPLRSTASVGGIYVPETFERWVRMRRNRHLVRFDVHDRRERELRVLGPHVDEMQRPHIAYIGRQDRWFIDNGLRLQRAASAAGSPFRMEMVEGDHMRSLPAGLAAYRALIAGPRPR